VVAVSQPRVAIDQGHHGSCRNCARAARDTQGPAPWLRPSRNPLRRAAQSRAALARPCPHGDHRDLPASKALQFVALVLAILGDDALQLPGHTLTDVETDCLDPGQCVTVAKLLFCFLGFDADPAGDREDLAVDVERDQTAPITLCEEIAAEARQIVRVLPRIPERLLDLGRIQIEPLGMLPFSSVKFSGSAGGPMPFRQLPTMFEVQILGQLAQAVLEVRQVECLHLFGIDPRPHNVGVPASVLFVDDDRAGLILKAERTLRAFSRTSPSRATASAGTRKASSSDALSTRPWHLKNVWTPVSPKEPGTHCFLPGTVTWVTYRFPRVLFGAAARPGLGFARLPGGCFKERRDLLFPAGAISLELTESSARRTTCTARACC
jgi:hypothetical protein